MTALFHFVFFNLLLPWFMVETTLRSIRDVRDCRKAIKADRERHAAMDRAARLIED